MLPLNIPAHSPPPPSTPSSTHDDTLTTASTKEKKPRVRHTDAQLAALNDLYDDDEHPSLEARAALAENLNMWALLPFHIIPDVHISHLFPIIFRDTKAVNAWFANKRSATKKKTTKSSKSNALTTTTPPPRLPQARRPQIIHDDDDDDWPQQHYPAWATPPPPSSDFYPTLPSDTPFVSGGPDHKHIFDGEPQVVGSVPRRMRMRPTTRQTEELRKLYELTSHPTREEREELGEKIGMRYQSVTNWFQNQRSLAKRRREDDASASASDAQPHIVPSSESLFPEAPLPQPTTDLAARTYTAFPPRSTHPSLAPLASKGHSRSHLSTPEPTLPISRSSREGSVVDQKPLSRSSRPGSRRHGSSLPPSGARPRRTRPEPYQLEALKKLYTRTANPSIEERGALALEVGMDIGKVTNWFRNLRQTARKRAAKAGGVLGDGGEDDSDAMAMMDFESAPVSRAGSPSLPFSSSASSSGDGHLRYEDDEDENGIDDEGHDTMDLDEHEHEHELRRNADRARERVREREEGDGSEGRPPHSHSDPDAGSEEELQEAVTPPPVSVSSPSPPPPPAQAHSQVPARRRMDVGFLTGVTPGVGVGGAIVESEEFSAPQSEPFEKSSTSVRVEDALLLLSFSRHIAQW
ncbi:hypothetical protein BD410DRAFT_835381 [Rickenella mellea]|uniref:Homeobox domain-containing protein n=1 Tax=Rickenella mellea TaxID=50990 RepID=A0A4Y7QM49_9AGAM|nr:hypothetical protein BD410DRAFT_835381 [Rickenella mellea]